MTEGQVQRCRPVSPSPIKIPLTSSPPTAIRAGCGPFVRVQSRGGGPVIKTCFVKLHGDQNCITLSSFILWLHWKPGESTGIKLSAPAQRAATKTRFPKNNSLLGSKSYMSCLNKRQASSDDGWHQDRLSWPESGRWPRTGDACGVPGKDRKDLQSSRRYRFLISLANSSGHVLLSKRRKKLFWVTSWGL